MTFSDSQSKVLVLLPILPSILSLMGSSTVVFRVVAKQTKKSPYDRILLGLSSFDVMLSLLVPVYSILVDKEKSEVEWALGNKASCSASAFLMQTLLVSSILYNGGLSLYFLATIRFGVTQEKFARLFEPVLHIIVILYPLSTGIAGLVGDMYTVLSGDGGLGCGVDEENDLVIFLFAGLPFASSAVAIIICNIVIYIFIRNTTNRTLRRSMSLDADIRRIRAVGVQAFLYVGSFLSSYIWMLLVGFISVYAGRIAPYPLVALSQFFFPMQGFWNGFIYAKPRYLKFRSAFEDDSRVAATRWAVFGENELDLPVRSGTTQNTSHCDRALGSGVVSSLSVDAGA